MIPRGTHRPLRPYRAERFFVWNYPRRGGKRAAIRGCFCIVRFMEKKVLWGESLDGESGWRKKGSVNFLPDGHKKMASDPHRTATTVVPLLRSHPGGLDRSWSCGTCRDKCTNIFHHSSNIFCFLSQFVPFFLRQSRTFGKRKTRRKSL